MLDGQTLIPGFALVTAPPRELFPAGAAYYGGCLQLDVVGSAR
jgi:hypothetical protein